MRGEIPDIDQSQRSITLTKVPELNVVPQCVVVVVCLRASKQQQQAVLAELTVFYKKTGFS